MGAVQIQTAQRTGETLDGRTGLCRLSGDRAIGEAATRTKSNDMKQLKDFMLSDRLLARLKGNPYRSDPGGCCGACLACQVIIAC
jgi:hypothetical protein